MRKLRSYPGQIGLAIALREIGPIGRALFILDRPQDADLWRGVPGYPEDSDKSDDDSLALSNIVERDDAQTLPGRDRLTPSPAVYDATARAGVNIHQFYSLDLKGAPAAALADIFEFEGTRGIGEPTKYTIQFTHPRHDLSRGEFLNRIGAFTIQPPPRDRWNQPESARHVQGVVTAFALKATNRDESLYEIVLESRLALLRNTPKCRFFLDMTIPEIIEQILREHGFNKIFAAFKFQLHRTYRKRSFVMQWGEDDLAFITRLCRRSGIWFVCEEGKRCELVRFGDDYAHYRRDPARLTAAYRSYSGLETGAQESVSALEMRAKTLPTTYAVRTFSTEAAFSEPIEATSPIHEDGTTYGEAYTWGTPNLGEDEAKEEAQLRREAALAEQVEYHGVCDMLDLTAGSVLKLSNRELADARHGLLLVRSRVAQSALARSGGRSRARLDRARPMQRGASPASRALRSGSGTVAFRAA